MIKIKILLCLLWLPFGLWAQQRVDVCGNSVMDSRIYAMYQQQVQQERGINFKSTQTVTLKLQPHIIRRSNGTGGLDPMDVAISIQQLNAAFLPVGFSFVACPPRYINNDSYYNEIVRSTDSSSLEYQMALPNRVPDAINVFFVPNGVVSSGSLTQINWSSLPSQANLFNRDWLVMNAYYAKDGETLAHEVGHYFNLLHTHRGVNQITAAEGISRDYSDPCTNCRTAVDALCDTEADPFLADQVDAACQYIGVASYCGRPYSPNTNNVMSSAYRLDTIGGRIYATSGCRTQFTPGQIDRMWAALIQERTNLANSCPSCPTSLNIVQDVFNGQSSTQTASNRITASNTIRSGGTAAYDAGVEVFLTSDFEVKLGADFDATIGGCTAPAMLPPAPEQSPAKPVPTPALSLRIAPNPTTEQCELTVSLPAERDLVTVILVNAQGQTVQQTLLQQALSKGSYQVTINTRDLPAGLYFVQVRTEQETVAKQLVVLKH